MRVRDLVESTPACVVLQRILARESLAPDVVDIVMVDNFAIAPQWARQRLPFDDKVPAFLLHRHHGGQRSFPYYVRNPPPTTLHPSITITAAVCRPGTQETIATERLELEAQVAALERQADDFAAAHSHAAWQEETRAAAQRRAALEELLPARRAELLSYRSEWQSKCTALREERQATAALQAELKGAGSRGRRYVPVFFLRGERGRSVEASQERRDLGRLPGGLVEEST